MGAISCLLLFVCHRTLATNEYCTMDVYGAIAVAAIFSNALFAEGSRRNISKKKGDSGVVCLFDWNIDSSRYDFMRDWNNDSAGFARLSI